MFKVRVEVGVKFSGLSIGVLFEYRDKLFSFPLLAEAFLAEGKSSDNNNNDSPKAT